MIKKKYYTWRDMNRAANSIIQQMFQDNWKPDYIVGISRGGLPLAVMLSHKGGISMETLKVQLRDGDQQEVNPFLLADIKKGDKVLFVDDINDSGSTFKWIEKNYKTNGANSAARFAVMTENTASAFGEVAYSYDEINKADEDVWLVYPYAT